MRRILLILIILGLAGGAVWYFTIRPKNPSQEEQTGSGFKSFFSLGENNNTNTDNNQIDTNETVENITQITNSAFKQLTPNPIAGYTVFSQTKKVSVPPASPKEKTTTQTITDYFIRYVARQSGFVYEIKNDIAPQQVSNIFIPAIYEAVFADDNQTAIIRFLKEGTNTVGTYSVPIPNENPDGTRTQKEGVFLPDNITGIAISPDLKELVRITPEQTQGVLNTSNSFNKNVKEIFKNPLKEWIVYWPEKNSIYLQTKAAGLFDGFLYKLETSEKRLRRVVGNVKGLTTSVSPSGKYVLYSESINTGFVAKILNTKTGSIKNTNLAILPEKCTWIKNEDLICAGNSSVENGTYPDAWYAGLISFSDQLFRIYTESNTFDVIYKNDEKSFDMTNLRTDEERSLLFFTDKKTGILWQFSF
jgi:hypothetical protein